MQQIIVKQTRNGRKMKMTILHRPGREWDQKEIIKFVYSFLTGASWDPKHPDSLILFGHFTEDQIRSVPLD